MSASAASPATSLRPVLVRLAFGAAFLCAVAACKKEEPATTEQAAAPAAGQPVAPPATAVSAEVAALSTDQLREKARAAYAQSKLYAPAGDNAMEYYLALRDKQPGDAGVSSALTDLMPMAVIATEQSRDREDFVEAQRLYALIEKADAQHPALARLKTTIADAQAALAKRAEQEKLTAEQEAQRQAQLEAEREKQQQEQQQQAAQQLAAQQAAEQQAAAQREADQRAAAQREAEERAAAARSAQQPATQPAQVAQGPAATAATAAAAPASAALRPLSTPAPRYPPEALRAGQSGEVQVEFTVNADGSVANARVVRANPPRVFDREAVAAVRRWRFEPVGEPVTTRRTIGFRPGE
jgi:protein TonB